ncbi:pro-Pol polyprotein [Trichonephila clavipes]|nr:pro-Pol polyprotein [Trichonephila clavipes]
MPAKVFLQNLRNHMQDLQPTFVSRHSKSKIFIHKNLLDCSHVFVRQDCVRRLLKQPYECPFEVISCTNKFFTLLIKGKKSVISVDRLKPAFMEIDDPVPAQVKSVPTASPAPPKNSPAQAETTTRYGRRARFRFPISSRQPFSTDSEGE